MVETRKWRLRLCFSYTTYLVLLRCLYRLHTESIKLTLFFTITNVNITILIVKLLHVLKLIIMYNYYEYYNNMFSIYNHIPRISDTSYRCAKIIHQ